MKTSHKECQAPFSGKNKKIMKHHLLLLKFIAFRKLTVISCCEE